MVTSRSSITIALVGNPNSGKTTVFNRLTGARQHIGNWPGVTVECRTGICRHRDRMLRIVDLPGIYSLSCASLDETITGNYLLEGTADLIVNVVDATNLEQHLYLTAQLLEMRKPMVVVLNKMDRAQKREIRIHVETLASRLGCPVFPCSASRLRRFEALKDVIIDVAGDPESATPSANISYPACIQTALAELTTRMKSASTHAPATLRWLAIKHLEGDLSPEEQQFLDEHLRPCISDHVRRITAECGEAPDLLIADARYAFVHTLCEAVTQRCAQRTQRFSDRIDRVVLHPWFGIPVFLGVMYFMFWFTMNVGGCFLDFFDQASGAVFVDGVRRLLSSWQVPVLIRFLLADGLGEGVRTVATFVPIIAIMFFCLAVLEDSGYMARAAVVMDRGLRAIGLPGKALVPLLVGFGCNVPAIMASRTLDQPGDRILTVMMSPLMSCGARMPVYALFAAAFFPHHGGQIVFVLYLIGMICAVATAFMLRTTLLQGEASMFVMEMPSYHWPSLYGLLVHTWVRLKSFVLGAGKIIILVVLLLSAANAVTPEGKVITVDHSRSILSVTGRAIVPVFTPMGLRQDNWPATVGLFTGVFAKETVIGTLNSLYAQMNDENSAAGTQDVPVSLVRQLQAAVGSVGANFRELELPFSVGKLIGADLGTATNDLPTEAATFGIMQKNFDGKAGAFAYLLIILLYMPCAAVVGAMCQEIGWRWAAFSCVYLSVLAWSVATVFYQAATFMRHPVSSMMWIGAIGLFFGGGWLALARWGCQSQMSRARRPGPQSSATSMPMAGRKEGTCCSK